MEAMNLNRRTLFEEISSKRQLGIAYELVRRNGGGAGSDGISVSDFGEKLAEQLSQLSEEVRSWKYKPQAVKRVEIPKVGSTKKRKLGIPSVKDRVLQTSIKLSLEPIFDPEFSQSSYGFRPGRSQRDAIAQAREFVNSGKEWVVDLDLEDFFDLINQDKLMHLLGRRIEDKQVLKLIGMTLRCGVVQDGKHQATRQGSPQGSPLSPLLSNIVLDELDKELENRNLAFCRFADDANIYVGSERAATRVLESITKFIEKRLKLKVNQDKSKASQARGVKFLGISIVSCMVVVSATSMQRAKAKVRELIPRRTHIPIEHQIEKVNRWYRVTIIT